MSAFRSASFFLFGSFFLAPETTPPATAAPTDSASKKTMPAAPALEKLTLGGGCFWCLDALYRHAGGVKKVVCGYAGGTTENPTYRDVCTGKTGHAEVVQITFDSAETSRSALLAIFWTIHDPTTPNRQGDDIGMQYRSVIFYETPAEKLVAEQSLAGEQKHLSEKIVTEILPLKNFWPAEEYHQNYFEKNPRQPYCSIVIAPKVKKFREKQSALPAKK